MHDYSATRNADGIWAVTVPEFSGDGHATVSTHTTEACAYSAIADKIAEEKRVLSANLAIARNREESAQRQLAALRTLIERLPWQDINSGQFSPLQGCGEVAAFRDAAIDFGCDADTLNDGAERDFVITAEVTLTVSFTINATSEETAHDLAEYALEGCHWDADGTLDDFDIEQTDETVTGVCEAC
jgi:hypothetical protein